jgi:putative transcriptional regulator
MTSLTVTATMTNRATTKTVLSSPVTNTLHRHQQRTFSNKRHRQRLINSVTVRASNNDDNDDDDNNNNNNNNDGEDNNVPDFNDQEDDVAPALEGDWREFRAKLVAQQSQQETPDEQIEYKQLQEIKSQLSEQQQKQEEQQMRRKKKASLIDDAIDNVRAESADERERRVSEATEANLELLKTQNPELAKDKPWAHVIAKPEKGSLIVAASDEFITAQQYFHQSVILLLDHSSQGSMGVILNRPTMYKMGQVSDENGPFSENALYFGGDVGDGTVSFLHGSADVEDSEEVSPGVFIGGFSDAGKLIQKGEKDPQHFKFFARYCGWGPGQLEAECARGVWYPVACSRQIALKPVIALPKPLWREVLELCSSELALKAKRAYDEN